MFDTPDAMRAAAWRHLSDGVANRDHPARTPVLATIGADGPQMRTVVLRGWAADVAEIHTDRQNAKIAEIEADPRVGLHVWLPQQRLQIRLSGTATLDHADTETWAAVPDAARKVYGGTPPPGTPIAQPDDYSPDPVLDRFTVIRISVASADLLFLGDMQYLRVQFSRDTTGWAGHWVAP